MVKLLRNNLLECYAPEQQIAYSDRVDRRFRRRKQESMNGPDGKRHLATPDGIAFDRDGRVTLCEIKTTNKAWRSIPRSYLRQVWWQQHVLGAERTLVAWEQHAEFVPIRDEPHCAWVERDEVEIASLVRLATALIDELHRRHLRGRQDERIPQPAAPRGPGLVVRRDPLIQSWITGAVRRGAWNAEVV